ncbi:Choline/ethanolamine kinase [Rhodospirillales bacterium URHD0017]|nr:Choline/ethanolamine kinase [Rhodospirillales bacterium URHD0017]
MTTALERRLDGRTFDLQGLEVRPIEHKIVAGATQALETIRCTVRIGHKTETLDFVAKALALIPGQEGRWRAVADPQSPFYWRREADFYARYSSWPNLPKLRSATCYQAWIGADEARIVLEKIDDSRSIGWDEGTIRSCLSRLAEAQAMEMPPRLSRSSTPFLTAYYDRRSELMDGIEEHMRPTGKFADVDAMMPMIGPLKRLHRNSSKMLADLATLPQVFSHNDFWQPNVFGECGPDSRHILIDYAYCDHAPAGLDAANFIVDGIVDGFLPCDRGGLLLDQALQTYLRRFYTLRPEHRSVDLIRAAKLAMALKYAWLIPATFKAAHSDESRDKLQKEHGSAGDFLNRRSVALNLVRELIADPASMFA